MWLLLLAMPCFCGGGGGGGGREGHRGQRRKILEGSGLQVRGRTNQTAGAGKRVLQYMAGTQCMSSLANNKKLRERKTDLIIGGKYHSKGAYNTNKLNYF